MQNNKEYVIEVNHLTQDYGHNRGVFDVSIAVKKGEVYGFLGPNGAGKSTTIRHLMGFSKPQSGETKINGLESFKNYYKILANVGYLPGEIALPEGLSGWEFIKMMGSLRKSNNSQMLKYLLDKFELNPAGETKKMSLGDKRKLAIVTAFMDDPDILILDEPTSGLDPIMQQKFIDFIKEEKQRGKTILLSSHMFNEVEETCDKIAIIKDGKIVSNFEASDITHNKNKKYIIQFKQEKDFLGFLKVFPKRKLKSPIVNKTCIVDENSDNLSVVVAVNDKNINELVLALSEYKVCKFSEKKLTLQDYFMQFYHEDINFGGIS